MNIEYRLSQSLFKATTHNHIVAYFAALSYPLSCASANKYRYCTVPMVWVWTIYELQHIISCSIYNDIINNDVGDLSLCIVWKWINPNSVVESHISICICDFATVSNGFKIHSILLICTVINWILKTVSSGYYPPKKFK